MRLLDDITNLNLVMVEPPIFKNMNETGSRPLLVLKCPKPISATTTLSQMICHQDKFQDYYSSHPFVPSMPTSCAAAASNDAKISLSVNLCGNRGKEPSLMGAWPLVGKLEWNWKEQMKVDADSYESIGFLNF